MNIPSGQQVYPGLNPNIRLSHFNQNEQKIIRCLASEWYVTNGGEPIQLSHTSIYRYVLIKPTNYLKQQFNLEREIVVVFSPYESFEPRTLDAFDAAARKHQTLRLERLCGILISMDIAV